MRENKLNPLLLDVIACPRCLAKLRYDKAKQQLICPYEQIAYPIKNNIPQLTAEDAVSICIEEIQPIDLTSE